MVGQNVKDLTIGGGQRIIKEEERPWRGEGARQEGGGPIVMNNL